MLECLIGCVGPALPTRTGKTLDPLENVHFVIGGHFKAVVKRAEFVGPVDVMLDILVI